MNEEKRDAVYDLIPKDMVVWDSENELEHFVHADMNWWMDQLGHAAKSPTHSCCNRCGCATTCLAGAFAEALISSVIRELDKIGLLKSPEDGK